MFQLKDSTVVWTRDDYNALRTLEKKLSRSCAKKKLFSLGSRWAGKLMKDGLQEAKNAAEEKAKESGETGQKDLDLNVSEEVSEGAGEDVTGSVRVEALVDLVQEEEACAAEEAEHEDSEAADTTTLTEESGEGEDEHELEEGDRYESGMSDLADDCPEYFVEGGDEGGDEENLNDNESEGIEQVDNDVPEEEEEDDNDDKEEKKGLPKKKLKKGTKGKKSKANPKIKTKEKTDHNYGDAVEEYAEKAIDNLFNTSAKSFDSEYEKRLWIYERVRTLRLSFRHQYSADASSFKRCRQALKTDIATWNWLADHKDWSGLDNSTREKMIKVLSARDKKGAKPMLTPTDSRRSIYLVALKSFFIRSNSAQ